LDLRPGVAPFGLGAVAPVGSCAVRALRRSGTAPSGLCAVRPAPFGRCAVQL